MLESVPNVTPVAAVVPAPEYQVKEVVSGVRELVICCTLLFVV
jgi:hypothetical protein